MWGRTAHNCSTHCIDKVLKIKVVEVPAVVGWFPDTFLQGTIDNGMRAGIPAEDWGAVVTLYGSDATRVQELTGNENPRNGRILLLELKIRTAAAAESATNCLQ